MDEQKQGRDVWMTHDEAERVIELFQARRAVQVSTGHLAETLGCDPSEVEALLTTVRSQPVVAEVATTPAEVDVKRSQDAFLASGGAAFLVAFFINSTSGGRYGLPSLIMELGYLWAIIVGVVTAFALVTGKRIGGMKLAEMIRLIREPWRAKE